MKQLMSLRRYAIRLLTVLLTMVLLTGAALADSFSFLPSRTEDGKEYLARPSSELTTLLLIGYDHYANGQIEEEPSQYHLGGQSDFLLLLVMDHKNQQIHQLQIDRDTMTPIKLVASNGKNAGTRRMQICLSHAYGKTREENNRNTIWAVENLLSIGAANDGAQIDYYISMDISGINKLNELVGGVTVTVPNDDLVSIDPALKGGETVKLTGMQAEYFTRTRYGTAEPTNEARMARQRIYMNSMETLLKEKVSANLGYVNTLLNGMGMIFDRTTTLDEGFGFTTDDNSGTAVTDTTDHYLMANVSMDNLALLVSRVLNYELLDVETLQGVHSLGSDGYIHFNLSENEALNWTLKTFYTEADAN